MQGIQFLIDEQGNKNAVQIDLNLYGEVWEDIYDLLLIHERKEEPRISLGQLKKKLVESGKLAGSE